MFALSRVTAAISAPRALSAHPASRIAAPQAARPRLHQPTRRALAPPLPHALPGTDPQASLQLDGDVRSQLPSWLTLVGFAALEAARRANFASVAITGSHIYWGLAWYTLIYAVLATLNPEDSSFDPVATTVGPIFLALNQIGFGGRLQPFPVAAALFGYFWIDQLPPFAYSRVAWGLTLAFAVFKGYTAQWLVCAFALSALWRLVNQLQAGGAVRPQELGFAGLACWALYKGAEVPLALMIMAAQLVAALIL
ncbi:hypothetical protein ABPG77_007629 [Micractinium sp. CCAP 211/92]